MIEPTRENRTENKQTVGNMKGPLLLEFNPAHTRLAVRRAQGERYILTSLIAFAVTVIITRVFLHLTGFPQVGNSVLHIAHALWGGLLLFFAVLLSLALANSWAFRVSALMSGIGIGLFIDEVGKFITQANDYFSPPALALIYGFFLLTVFGYLYFRRKRQVGPRQAMYHVLEGLQEILDGDLDAAGAGRIETLLAVGRQSDRDEIVSLANVLGRYLQQEKPHLTAVEPDLWKRITRKLDTVGLRLGRRQHRAIISMILILWLVLVIAFITVLAIDIPTLTDQVVIWRIPLIIIQVVVGSLLFIALFLWLSKNEETGIKFGIAGFSLSLVSFQMLYFYLSQFSAIIATLFQLVFILVMLAYRCWYLVNNIGSKAESHLNNELGN